MVLLPPACRKCISENRKNTELTDIFSTVMTNSEPQIKEEPPLETKKKEVSIDDLYRRSSQFQLWSYTIEELDSVKRSTHEDGRIAAIERFNEVKATMSKEKPEAFQQYSDELTSEKLLNLITFDEQQKYLQFFAQQIIQTCTHFRMPTQVKATAVSFFQRFFLINSPMSYHPKNIVFTCVFLAAKLENYFISIDSFCDLLPKTEKLDILNLEFDVLQSLKFTLLVHHPFRPLYGFFLDLQQVLLHPSPVMSDVNIDVIGGLYDQAKRWLNDHALIGDVLFLFTPPQIALAALFDCNSKVTGRYLAEKFQKTNKKVKLETINEEVPKQEGENTNESGVSEEPKEADIYEQLLETIKLCISVAKAEIETSREECILIDKKCVYLLNPGKVIKKKIKSLSGESTSKTA